MDSKLKEAVVKGKNGDKQSLAEIFNETKDMVYFTVLKLIKNESDAQDLVQDIYIKAFQSLRELKDENAFIKWLKIIAVNSSKNYLKKCKPLLFKTGEEEEKKLASIPEINEDFLPAEYADQKEKCRLIMEIVDSLPTLQRTAVMLYYFDELSMGEVAEIMETSDGTTKSRLNYARKEIKEKVEQHEKKGTKLYGIQAVPFLWMVLRNASKDYSIPLEVSKNILESSLAAAENIISSTTSGTTAAVSTIQAANSSATSILGKFFGASMATKIITGVVTAGLLMGGGIGISKVIKNSINSTAEKRGGIEQIGYYVILENMEWEKFLGESKEELTAKLGKAGKEVEDELYYDVYYENGDIVKAALKIHIDKDDIVTLISSGVDNYALQGIKKGDKLEQVKLAFKGIAGAALDSENVDCGELSAIFYTIGDYSYQFLYDEKEVVSYLSISIIRHEEYVEEPSKAEGTVSTEVDKPSQVKSQPPQGKIEVKDLIFADKQSIIKTLGKPIDDNSADKCVSLLYDGISINQEFSNEDLEFSTHQQNYLITINSSKYSAYGFYPGMTKEQFLENTKNYPIGEESFGVYEFAFPGNGTTVLLYVDFSMGGTASEVSLQAFVEW